jgi:hypothetical protein
MYEEQENQPLKVLTETDLLDHSGTNPVAVLRGKATADLDQVFIALARSTSATNTCQALQALATKMIYDVLVDIRDGRKPKK